MDKLYPIVRRVRRSLLPPDAVPPEVAAQATKKAETAAPATEPTTQAPKSDADVAEQ